MELKHRQDLRHYARTAVAIRVTRTRLENIEYLNDTDYIAWGGDLRSAVWRRARNETYRLARCCDLQACVVA